MSDTKIKAVIFDIDGTLSEKNSWQVLAEGLGGSVGESVQIYLDNKNGTLTDVQASHLVFGMWTRTEPVTKQKFTKILSDIPLRPEVMEVSEYLKAKNILICLITGSNEMYAELVAKKIGADSYYANAKLFWNDKDELENFSYQVNQGPNKLRQFKDFCAKYNLQPEECMAVGDGDNDRELFELTKHGIAIHPEDEVLEKMAWKIIDNLSEIKDII